MIIIPSRATRERDGITDVDPGTTRAVCAWCIAFTPVVALRAPCDVCGRPRRPMRFNGNAWCDVSEVPDRDGITYIVVEPES